jgi:3-hydroxyacyl-CoA dehydrogenase/enoyl-CoA hydratase/3-hydroxybutyryl-CoA epimerase
MTYNNFTLETDADGIALITWDMPDKSMNVFTQAVMDELDRLIDEVTHTESIKGAIIASGKKAFSGGADLAMLSGLLGAYQTRVKQDPQQARQQLFEESRRLSVLFRKLETCGKPFLCAINGTCLGGAFELALACHGRIVAEGDHYKMGLPEVKVGLFPGAGGTQRVMRMSDPQAGLTMLLKGEELKPKKAKALGLIDTIVPEGELIATAKAMLKEGVDPVKPWDKKGYKLQGAARIYSAAGAQFWPAANAHYVKETHDNYPGARGIMHSCYEGLLLPMDLGLRVESRYFAHAIAQPECANMIRSLFVSMQELNKGARRPKEIADTPLDTIAVLGAGFMGAGIASVAARAGLNVILLDRDQASAEQGKEKVRTNLDKLKMRGKISDEAIRQQLERITPAEDYAHLSRADLVIEAVFEDRQVKAKAIEKAAQHTREDVIFASNTSTLPITSLAEHFPRPEQFIGLHFFSPVEKMMLVEVIRGAKTGKKALAVALDMVRRIKKTPIVVNDTRGFYVNRCVLNYMLEAHLMLLEGVPAAMVDNVARQMGMPVGPLALNDEVGLDLGWKILQATKKDLGAEAINPAQEKLLEEMVVKQERLGRKNGKGFYDYEGKNKRLWPGLKEICPVKPADEFSIEVLKDRFMAIQALEAAKVMEEGVVSDPREADVGSILGYGFAPYTGGTLSYIDTLGADNFVELCQTLADQFGDRFAPTQGLKTMATKNTGFYEVYS